MTLGDILQVIFQIMRVFFFLTLFVALEEPEVLANDIISFSTNCLNFGDDQKKEL